LSTLASAYRGELRLGLAYKCKDLSYRGSLGSFSWTSHGFERIGTRTPSRKVCKPRL